MRLRKRVLLAALSLAALLIQGSDRFPSLGTAGERVEAGTRRRDLSRSHVLLRLATLDRDTARELARRGLRPVSFVPPDGVVVRASNHARLDGPWVVSARALRAPDKLSARIGEEGLYVAEFHPGVDPGEMRAIAHECGLAIREHADLAGRHLLAGGTRAQIEELARWDEVAYIFPASPELAEGQPVAACAGAVTEFGPVAHYVTRAGEGWDGPGLNAAVLNWVVAGWSARLARDTQRAEFERALNEWSRHVQVDFSPHGVVRGARTIELLFARGDHGDGFPFDGPGRVLAHTFYPAPPNPEPLAGDVHLDEDESWSAGGYLDLYSVVLHELGHALGLGHSDLPGAVMYPYYRRAQALTEEDIRAIRQLYAARTQPPAAPPQPPSQPPAAPPSNPPAPPANPTPANNAPPVVAITYPAGSNTLTRAAAITIRGTARDSDGIAEVTWTAAGERAGTADGKEYWSAQVPLLLGANPITVTARDNAGKTAWRTVTVTRR